MKWKYVLIGILIFILILTLSYTLIPPKINLKNEETNIYKKYNPKYTVTRFGLDYTKKTKVSNKVNTKKLGEYNLIFKTKIGFRTFKQIKKVKVIDKEKPVITLNGNNETYVCKNKEYQDEGATAKDNYDGDITNKIKTKVSKEKVIYTVSDKAKNKAKKTRKLIEGDITPPTLTLNGTNEITIYAGDKYNEPGVKANDNCDDDISNNIVTSGSVDTNKIGTYTLTYSVIDSNNNKAEITRNIKVIARPVYNGTGKAGTIYLTFDDGPMQGTTNIILDILKEEGIKATFFVTKNGPDSLIKREFDEGHTVALHTYSHNYQTCYSSVNAYFDDLNKIQTRVKNITGTESKIIRFPGGSSNTISRNYSKGIMTTLTNEVQNRGYIYFDWNVSSGDAGSTTSPNGVYNNVINGLRKNRANIVLMHDIKTYTRDALRNIIRYGKQNGYSFDRITSNTTPYHQNVNN